MHTNSILNSLNGKVATVEKPANGFAELKQFRSKAL